MLCWVGVLQPVEPTMPALWSFCARFPLLIRPSTLPPAAGSRLSTLCRACVLRLYWSRSFVASRGLPQDLLQASNHSFWCYCAENTMFNPLQRPPKPIRDPPKALDFQFSPPHQNHLVHRQNTLPSPSPSSHLQISHAALPSRSPSPHPP